MSAAVVVHDTSRAVLISTLRFPFTVMRSAVGLLRNVPSFPLLRSDNRRLQAALTRLELENAQLREHVRRVQAAHTLLETGLTSKGVVADVIGRSPLPTQQTLLINQGSRQGVLVGQVVVDARGVVGRVVEARASTAFVLLLTDPESRVTATIERSRETGLLVGEGLGQCRLLYLDAHTEIQAGDQVIAAGLGGSIPKGLPLGKVARVVRDDESGSAFAWVIPAAGLDRVEEVLCVSSSGKNSHLE